MSTSAQESNAPTSSILQSQTINSVTQKRSLAEDGEPTRHQKSKKRKKASDSSNLESNLSVVAVTSVPHTVPATSAVLTRPLDVTDSPSHRRDERKKRKKKKRKMSIVTNSEFEDDRAKPKPNGSLSIAPASATSVVSQNSALPRRMKEETEDLSDLEISVALRNASEKKKGKEKALPRPPSPQDWYLAMSNRRSTPMDVAAQEEIQRLKQQLEAQSQLLKKHKACLTGMHHSLTCQICLDLLYKPFVASCGHVACYGCLVRWFTAPAPGELVPDNENNNQNNAAPNGIIGNHVHKRKTCPICRARITERPVEVWAIKDMVNTLVRSKLLDVVPSASAEDGLISTNEKQANQASGSNGRSVQDPWEKVFRPARNVYGNNPWWHGWVGDADEVHERVEGELEEVGMYDTEDHVHRCLDCMHEIWDGQCSHCGRAYPGHPEADEDEEGDASDSEEMMEFEEEYTDEEMEYGLTLGEVLDRMYGDDRPTWEYGPEGEEEEEEFFTDEEGADWGDDPVFGGMGAVIWQDAHDEEPGFAHVEEIHDDEEQHGRESADDEDQYESSFINDSDGDRERNSAAESVSESEDEDMRNTAIQMGRAVRLGVRRPRLVVDSEDEGEVRPQRNNQRRG